MIPTQRSLIPSSLLAAALAVGASLPQARAQTQSLAFTGGVLLNPQIRFGGLGAHPPATFPSTPDGAAVQRTYDDGFNGIDEGGNANGTTAHWGYRTANQVRGDRLVLSSQSAGTVPDIEDSGDFIQPSANLEYRGSLGPVGASDWGILLGIGYQVAGGDASFSQATDSMLVEDGYGLGGLSAADLPPAPYSGTTDPTGPRIGSVPERALLVRPGSRRLDGQWEFDGQFLPVTGGLYLESQIAGRLNGIVSAGILAMFVRSEFDFREASTLSGLPTRVTEGRESANEVVLGGFAQLGLDWALWDKVSLVASARWQPAETFRHEVGGRSVEVDFTTAFAVHGGFSVRF